MADAPDSGEELITTIKNAAGIILGVTDNRSWIEIVCEGDLMHTKTVDLAGGSIFDVYVENISHKTTVYEHPRTKAGSWCKPRSRCRLYSHNHHGRRRS